MVWSSTSNMPSNPSKRKGTVLFTETTCTHPVRRSSLIKAYLRLHRKGTVAALAVAMLAVAVTAGVILIQIVSITPSAAAPDVIFSAGDDYAAINALDYATLTIGPSGTSASLAIAGIPGASDLQLTNLLDITNQHVSSDYSVALTRSASLDADIDNFTITVKNAADTTIMTWFVKDAASATSFTLPAGETYTIDIRFLIDDGVVAGNLDSFDLQFSLTEV